VYFGHFFIYTSIRGVKINFLTIQHPLANPS